MRHVVGAAILENGRILAAQRGPLMSGAGVWEFPGGKVESGESEEAALIRELGEELHLQIKPLYHLGEVQRPERKMRLSVWICERTGGEPVLTEHADVRWVGADELHSLDWSEPDRPFLPELKKILEGRP